MVSANVQFSAIVVTKTNNTQNHKEAIIKTFAIQNLTFRKKSNQRAKPVHAKTGFYSCSTTKNRANNPQGSKTQEIHQI